MDEAVLQVDGRALEPAGLVAAVQSARGRIL
jgi:hypothetical protein